jgi:uncharacterized protein YndB with AHSA1/START domain
MRWNRSRCWRKPRARDSSGTPPVERIAASVHRQAARNIPTLKEQMESSLKLAVMHCMSTLLAGSCAFAPAAAEADGPSTRPAARVEAVEKSTFVYTSYIKTTPEALWNALTTTAVIQQIWAGATIESDWKAGAAWKLLLPGGRIADAGEIVEFEPPRRLVMKWRNEISLERKAEGYSRCTYDISPVAGATRITSHTRLPGHIPDSLATSPTAGHSSFPM